MSKLQAEENHLRRIPVMKGKNKLFVPVKKSISEMIDEINVLMKCNEWDGKRFKSPVAGTPSPTPEFLNSPNYFSFTNRSKRGETLDITLEQKVVDEVIAGRRKIVYKEVNEQSMATFVDVRESSDGLILNNPNLMANDDIRLDAYAHGIFGFVPRYYGYIHLISSESPTAVTATIKGVCFMPEPYHRGGLFRCNYSNEVEESAWQKAKKKGKEGIQDLLYAQNGPDTNWIIGILLGKIID